MSILFHKKSQKFLNAFFAVFAVLIIASMILLYMPGLWR
jgi:hypothetical protein